MIELNGKYNNCKVFTDNCDNETISQLMNILNLEPLKDEQVRIMPDCHAGKGCVVGTTMTLKNKKVIPNLVGVDIGCGMYAVKIDGEMNFEKLDKVVNEYVPSGFNIHESPIETDELLEKLCAPVDIERANKSLGTLGGGNHFIEVDVDTNGNYWLVIHTGSRHLGIEVCNYYQELGAKNSSDNSAEIKRVIEKLKSEGRQNEIQDVILGMKKKISIPKDLCYIEGADFDKYIKDMEIVQHHAKMNRISIAEVIMKHMGWKKMTDFTTIHNYIDTKNMILRKGSVSAEKGEKLIIPMNMRDGSLICTGKGNPDWNFSAPHGAGRIMSRSKAKDDVDLEEFKATMNGIFSTSVCDSTKDESPFAYKAMEEIIRNIAETVDIIDRIKPVYNFKAH